MVFRTIGIVPGVDPDVIITKIIAQARNARRLKKPLCFGVKDERKLSSVAFAK